MILAWCMWLLRVPLWFWQAVVLTVLWALPVCYFLAPIRMRRMLLVGCIFSACILTSMLAARYTADGAWWCSLFHARSVYAGPSERYHVVSNLDDHASVCITDMRGDWVCVCNENNQGWLPLTVKR